MIQKTNSLYHSIYKFFASNNFTIIETISKNVNSDILLTSNNFIIKTSNNKNAYLKEIKALELLKNFPEIIKIEKFWQETFTYSNDINYNIMLPYYKDGDLFEFIKEKKLTFVEYKKIFKMLLQPIKICHDNDIIHIDVKLENFLIKKNKHKNIEKIVLIDFGFAHKFSEKEKDIGYVKLEKCYGTPEYINPDRFDKLYGKFSDIWCLGIIFYIFVFNDYPKRNFKNEKKYINLGVETKNFLDSLLDYNYTKRLTIDQVINDKFLN